MTALLSYLVPLEPRRRECHLEDIVEGALGPLGPKIERKALQVVREGWERNMAIHADPDLLEQAVHAVLGNAVEASPVRGRIDLALSGDGDAVELRIDDQGARYFLRARAARALARTDHQEGRLRTRHPGAWKICEAHGGTMAIRRRGEGGTRVTVSLPHAARPVEDR